MSFDLHILRHDSLLRIYVRRTNAREEGLWKTKNNVLRLVIEDRDRQYRLWLAWDRSSWRRWNRKHAI